MRTRTRRRGRMPKTGRRRRRRRRKMTTTMRKIMRVRWRGRRRILRDFVVSPVSKYFSYSRDFVVVPVSRHFWERLDD